MSALPLGSAADVPRSVHEIADFWNRFTTLESEFASLWDASGTELPVVGERTSWMRRLSNFRHSRRFIDRLATAVGTFPDGDRQRLEWRQRLRIDIQQFGEQRLGWPEGYRDLLVAEEFYEATTTFVRQARAFDPQIRGPEVAQALRNVWIVNSLQMLLDLEVELTPAVIAYSMLYPYTDNYLDDPQISSTQKRSLNRGLGRYLAGKSVTPKDDHQGDVYRLVALIEEQFDRHRFPAVFQSLLAIHEGQKDSLLQQTSGPALTAESLLEISVRKGGASVLADGYLAAGELSPAEEEFCFGYGVFLQFLDDLQDVTADLEAGHQTLFTLAVREGPLDRITSRLYHFMHAVVEDSECIAGDRYAACRDLILRNCTLLLVGAIAESPKFFSRGFRRHMARRWSLGLRSMRRLRRRGERRFRFSGDALCRSNGVASLTELFSE